MSAGCTVRVCGFPTDLPPERVADKLTIHFLRARNGGGEIVNIEFPPGPADGAVVTFENSAGDWTSRGKGFSVKDGARVRSEWGRLRTLGSTT